MLGYDGFFHFWWCVGVSLSSHREPGRQLAEGCLGLAIRLPMNTVHTLLLGAASRWQAYSTLFWAQSKAEGFH